MRVHDAGATIMPAMPAFYYAPKKIEDLVEQFAYRVLVQLGLPQEKQYRWEGRKEQSFARKSQRQREKRGRRG
jgi:3-polyprenyl-4-hydroxybenzoate decarboxylase